MLHAGSEVYHGIFFGGEDTVSGVYKHIADKVLIERILRLAVDVTM